MKQLIPGLLLLITIFSPTTSIAQSTDLASQDDIVQHLTRYMDRVVEKGFSGGVTIAIGDEVVSSRGYGLADQENAIPFSNETVFPIGSITKQFTGAAILKLEEMGKLRVTDLISEYFEDVPDDKDEITIHHLLTHASGLPGAIGKDFEKIGREAYVNRALQTELLFELSSGYEYSNVGYSLLAAIIEQQSGKSYDAFVQEYLFAPAGMSNTGYDLGRFEDAVLAHGYREGEDWGTFADQAWMEDGPYWNLRGNGGLLSTLDDMLKWHHALLDNTVLSDASRAKYFAPHQQEGRNSDSYYGYGWVIVETPFGKVIQHNGGNPHFSSDMRRYVDHGAVIFVTASTAEHRAFPVIDAVEQILFGIPVQLPPLVEKELSMDDLAEHIAGPSVVALLEMLKGDPEDVLPFVEKHMSERLLERYSADGVAANFKEDQDYLGTVEIRSIKELSPTEIGLVVRPQASPEWLLLTIAVDEASPHRIVGFGVDDAG